MKYNEVKISGSLRFVENVPKIRGELLITGGSAQTELVCIYLLELSPPYIYKIYDSFVIYIACLLWPRSNTRTKFIVHGSLMKNACTAD